MGIGRRMTIRVEAHALRANQFETVLISQRFLIIS